MKCWSIFASSLLFKISP